MDNEKNIELENDVEETEGPEEAEGLEELDGVIGEPLNIEDIDILVPQDAGLSVSGTSMARYDPLQHYMAEIRRYRYLTKEEEMRLAIKYKEEGDLDAISKLIMANLKLVIIIAMEYKRIGINMMDLIQEGNLGLMQAVKKFDPYRNLRLVT